ncbi:uncharacterized protein LOC134769676 [Penaeus indicus]|uniref:uncharacterized protein LOC134769676 n=1 Tax=Penaeus indicus TaxID=29960 RepID=UPI00300D4CD4
MRSVIVVPVIVGSLGSVTKKLDDWLEKLDITNKVNDVNGTGTGNSENVRQGNHMEEREVEIEQIESNVRGSQIEIEFAELRQEDIELVILNNTNDMHDVIKAVVILTSERVGVKRKREQKRRIKNDIGKLRKDLSRTETWFKGNWINGVVSLGRERKSELVAPDAEASREFPSNLWDNPTQLNESLGYADEHQEATKKVKKALHKEITRQSTRTSRRWKDYCAELFGREEHGQEEIERGEEKPLVLEADIEAAIKKAKKGKAFGIDEVPAEALKAGGETIPGTQDCTKYRTVSLITHASRILLEILRQRLAHYLVPQIAEEQFGFTAGKGTTEAILVLRNIIQKVAKKQEADQVWFLFVDYSKAFDSVYHDALWKTLLDLGVPSHLTWLLKGLYN